MLIHCDRRATTKTWPFRPKAGTNTGYAPLAAAHQVWYTSQRISAKKGDVS